MWLSCLLLASTATRHRGLSTPTHRTCLPLLSCLLLSTPTHRTCLSCGSTHMASTEHVIWFNAASKALYAAEALYAAGAQPKPKVRTNPNPEMATVDPPAAPELILAVKVLAGAYAEERPLTFVAAVSMSCGVLAVSVSSVLKPFATLSPTTSDAHDFVLLQYNLMRILVIGEC